MDNDFAMGYAMGADAGNNCNNNGNGMGFGSWGDLAALLVVAGIFGGGGWGFGGFGGGGGGMMLNGIATRADINEGFALQNITGGIRGIQEGICDATYNLNTNLMSGFHGVDNAICSLGYNIQQGFNDLGYRQQSCCCETQRLIERGFCDIGHAMSNNTRDINDTIRDGFARIEAQNNARYVADLERKLNACDRDSALQGLGTYLINTLRPSPIPAYPSCNPWGGSGGNWNGCNNGCGFAA